jgi:trans-aconitate 2-methyltransferase
MSWDPSQYLKFSDARKRPALDLLARLADRPPGRIVDLGCGAGNITRLLAESWPGAQVTAIDSDPAMLAKAAAAASTIRWQLADIAGWRADFAPDLIFSNAALHWLDDHRQLLPALIGQLAAHGVLAVQMPANFNEPSHRILLELADDSHWRELLRGVRQGSVLPVAEYHELLTPHCRRLDLWETTYWHVLSGEDAVIEWMKGTTLLPYLARLDGETGEAFLLAYRARLNAAYPRRPDGQTLFPFKRIFLIAER